jgi:hypothetical protein
MKTKEKTTELYRKFTEHNDWEGEIWHFYIPINGNESALADLERQVKAVDSYSETGYDFPFKLSKKILSATEVKVLVENGDDDGYMPKHNLLKGILTLPSLPHTLNKESFDAWFEHFYKGGICEMFSKPKRTKKQQEPSK